MPRAGLGRGRADIGAMLQHEEALRSFDGNSGNVDVQF